MRNAKKITLLTTLCIVALSAFVWSAPKTMTIQGYVLDSACAFTKNLGKPVSAACAVQCAKAGSPLIILASDGTVYWPISDSTPATGQNSRLMEFAGKRVKVTGKVYERGGSRAVVIGQIEPY